MFVSVRDNYRTGCGANPQCVPSVRAGASPWFSFYEVGYSDLSEAMSMEKRYFTSDLTNRS
jgi:hypothetical protein